MEFAESYKHLEVYKYAQHLAKESLNILKAFREKKPTL